MKLRSKVFLVVFLVALAIGMGCDGENPVSGPNNFHVDGRTYNEVYTCSQQFTGQAAFCADQNVTDQVIFEKQPNSTFEVRDVPDTGYLKTGSFSGQVFNWTATSPNGYTEQGQWIFTSHGDSWSGSSTYVADNATYTGSCNNTGAVVPNAPPDPAGIGACP